MPYRALLLGLLLALPARAGDPPPEIIDDTVLEPHLKEFNNRFEQVRKNTLKLDEFVTYYQQRAQAKGTPRDRAINAFLYGYALHNVVLNGKGSKEAKREFERAIELEPKLLGAYVELGAIAEEAGNPTEAERQLRRALEIKPAYVRAVVALGQMAQRAGDLDRAKALFQQSLDMETTVPALAGLILVNTLLFQKSFDDKDKERFAQEALGAVEALTTLDPESANFKLFKAQVLLQLGRVKEATEYLEGLLAGGTLKPPAQVEVLRLLRKVYQAGGNVAGVKQTLERLLKCEGLRPEERQRIVAGLKDVDKMGRAAFLKWQVEELIQVLHNEGLGVEERQRAQRALHEFVNGELADIEELKPLAYEAWRELFRLLVDETPELILTELQALRKGRPPANLMTVLVHFVYPNGRTEEVREEGVRTLAACGGAAAIPAIYYSIQDQSGRVVREVDNQLSALCETRSPLGGGLEPFTDDQIRQSRRMWASYFHSDEGAQRLARSFQQLSGTVLRVKPDRTSAPMIDHAANVILDRDMPWCAWVAAYDFLVKYWGKDFRPVERRGKPVEEFEREHVTSAFETDYARMDDPQPVAAPPGGSDKKEAAAAAGAGMAKGK